MRGTDGNNPDGENERFDEEWAQIVRNISDSNDTEPGKEIAAEADKDQIDDAEGTSSRDDDDTSRPLTPGPRDWSAEDDEGHFIPPQPELSEPTDPMRTLGWAGLIAAPITLVFLGIFGDNWQSWVFYLCLGVFIASALILLWRMPTERREDDDNDGAVV